MSRAPWLRRLFAGGATPARALEAAQGPARALDRLARGPALSLEDDAALTPLVLALDPFEGLGVAFRDGVRESVRDGAALAQARDAYGLGGAAVHARDARHGGDTAGPRRERSSPPDRTRPRVAAAHTGPDTARPAGRKLRALALHEESPEAVARRVSQILADVAPQGARRPSGERPRQSEPGPRAPRPPGPTTRDGSRRSAAAASPAAAEAALRERAERSGARASVDDVLAFPRQDAAVLALLERHRPEPAPAAPSRREETPRAERPTALRDDASARPSPDVANDAGAKPGSPVNGRRANLDGAASLATIARVLERRRPPQAPSHSPGAAETSRDAEPPQGLRGLAARFAGQADPPPPRAPSFEEPPRAPTHETLPTIQGALPASIAERLDDEHLAERIDRVLRAEARRQGIDLEGVVS